MVVTLCVEEGDDSNVEPQWHHQSGPMYWLIGSVHFNTEKLFSDPVGLSETGLVKRRSKTS